MKRSIQLCVALLCLLGVMLVALSACTGSRPSATVTVNPIDDGGLAGRPTVAVPYGQMTFSDLMALNGSSISWARLSKYTHSMQSGTSAVFYVADTYGEQMELQVTFDADADAVTRADLLYGELTVSLLTDDDSVLIPVLEALRAHHGEADAAATTTTAAA